MVSIFPAEQYRAFDQFHLPAACLHRAAQWRTFHGTDACSDHLLEEQQREEEEGKVFRQVDYTLVEKENTIIPSVRKLLSFSCKILVQSTLFRHNFSFFCKINKFFVMTKKTSKTFFLLNLLKPISKSLVFNNFVSLVKKLNILHYQSTFEKHIKYRI